MKKYFPFLAALAVITLLFLPLSYSSAYPVWGGFEKTGIKRLVRLTRMDSARFTRTLDYGARHALPYVRLNLVDRKIDSNLVATDAALEQELEQLIPNGGRAYSLAVMDITPGRTPRYAERNAEASFQPGSVGKLAVITALMCELENVFVDSIQKRFELMKTRTVKGGPFAVYDHHTIPYYEPETERYSRPRINEQHEFNLYEWADHMLSVSNNGAASVLWREAILMRVFGTKYPDLTADESEAFFRTTPRGELRDLSKSVIREPLAQLGISPDEFRVGTMFTRGASGIVPPEGGSAGTPRALMKWLTALESGNISDLPSSLEIKRLMYATDRRIRYAHAPVLDSAAVYFKSGSLYGCLPNTSCGKYRGNRMNYMNSVCIVEQPDGTRYLVALMSNVLGRNSAYDHQLLATRIDRMIRRLDPVAEPKESDGTGEDQPIGG